MSLYYDDDAPETLEDISNTLDDYARSVAQDLTNLDYALREKKNDDAARLWGGLEDKAESLQYLAGKLYQISEAFAIINRIGYKSSKE